jgi:hypothetical protein
MKLSGIKAGDIVRVCRKGRDFIAFVEAEQPGGLRVDPITAGVTWREVKALEVTGHYRRSKQSTDHLGKGLT